MTALRAWFRETRLSIAERIFWWRKPAVMLVDVEYATPQASVSYRVGWENGYWSGILKGRRDLIAELEAIAAARNATLDDVTEHEVTAAKLRTTH